MFYTDLVSFTSVKRLIVRSLTKLQKEKKNVTNALMDILKLPRA